MPLSGLVLPKADAPSIPSLLQLAFIALEATTIHAMRLQVYLCATALICVACGPPSPLRVGIVLDQDGQRGALLAIEDINSAGGIRGRPLELRTMSGVSSTSAREALAAAESLVTDPSILAVVGHTNSSASLAASQVYNEHHLVQIAPTTTAPLYSSAGPYSFRMVASDTHQGAFLGAIVVADSSHPRTAVLYVNDDYGRALRATFVQSLAAHGEHPVYEAPFEDGGRFTDAAAVARAIVRSHPTLLVWLGRSAELRALMPLLRAAIPTIRVLSGDGFSGPQPTVAQSVELIGVRYVRFLDASSTTPAIRLLAERYRQRWHAEFTDQFSLTYDAVRLLAEAIRAVGADRAGIQEYLASMGTTRPSFEGVSGPITFDANGDPAPAYFLAEVTAEGSKPITLPASVRTMR